MKVSVTIYSFMQLISSGKKTPLECIGIAKEMGFDAIEFVDFVFPEGTDRLEYARQLRAECDRVGLPVSNYAVGADFLNGSNGDTAAEIAKTKENVDIAAILGCPTMRHDISAGPNPRTYKGYDNVLPQLADAVREVAEYAAAKGVKTCTENHGYFSQDSLRVEKLVNTVAHENFGLLCDIGNCLCADEDPVVAIGRTAPYAFYAHAKDFHIKDGNGPDPGEGFFTSRNGTYLRGAIIGQGNVPVLHCLRALKRAGYDGTISVEFEGMEDCLTGIRIGLANMRKYISML